MQLPSKDGLADVQLSPTEIAPRTAFESPQLVTSERRKSVWASVGDRFPVWYPAHRGSTDALIEATLMALLYGAPGNRVPGRASPPRPSRRRGAYTSQLVKGGHDKHLVGYFQAGSVISGPSQVWWDFCAGLPSLNRYKWVRAIGRYRHRPPHHCCRSGG